MTELHTVKVTCPHCGPRVVRASSLHISAPSTETGLFAFTCSNCRGEIWHAAEADTLFLLKSAGAQPLRGVAPLELTEHHEGLPISWDELLDSHQTMRDHCCPQDELTG